VWSWIFPTPWLLVALGQSQAGCGLLPPSPPISTQLSCSTGRCLLSPDPFSVSPRVGSVPRSSCLAAHPRSQQDSSLASMCSGHCSQNTRPMAPAHSRCHQLSPVHIGGAGLRHTTPAQPCAGQLEDQHHLQPSLPASANAAQQAAWVQLSSYNVYFSNTNERLKLIIDW